MDNFYIQRCFDLARLGAGAVSPNPMVGAVLVHEGRIIGEGFHEKYGQAHAEVNAVASVKAEDRHLIPHATIYVSLEPCCIYGRTPPCTNLILDNKIPKVVISALDQTPGVSGQSVDLLRNAGVEVVTQVLEDKGKDLAQIRNTFAAEDRPYTILKFAKSKNGIMAAKEDTQLWFSNTYSKRLVHKWRSEVDAILVGTNTAKIDNPRLNNRLYYGKSPLRLLIDRHLELAQDLHLFNGEYPSLIFTERTDFPSLQNVEFVSLDFQKSIIPPIFKELRLRKCSSLMVEGGPTLLSSFIAEEQWDEARILESEQVIEEGIPAPFIPAQAINSFRIHNDSLSILRRASL